MSKQSRCHAQQRKQKVQLNEGPFTAEEDDIIRTKVKKYGGKDWKKISSYLPGRTAKQIRNRCKNYLFNNPNKKDWDPDEDELLLELYALLGSRWTKIACYFKNRSDINVKNRFSLLKRREKKIKKILESDCLTSEDDFSSCPTTTPNSPMIFSINETDKLETDNSKAMQYQTMEPLGIDFWSWESLISMDDLILYDNLF